MKQNSPELVVLVDSRDRRVGVVAKQQVHGKDTPLHRAFSVFVFNNNGELLVTQRAKTKKTWPGVWSNTCCGHPKPGERRNQAVTRRVQEELGIKIYDSRKVTNYQYKFERDGVVENEICPVYVAKTNQNPKPNKAEVEDYLWLDWQKFKREITADKKGIWSEWCKEEAELVDRSL